MQPAVLESRAEWRKQTTPIAALLHEPIADRLRNRDRIVVVPDELPWKVPFEGAAGPRGDLSSAARVTYATPWRRWPAAAVPPPRPPIASLPGLSARPLSRGDPCAGGADAARWKEPDAEASLTAGSRHCEDLRRGRDARDRADATEATVRARLETSDLVHVVAPLQMSGPTPLFSSLLLGGGGHARQRRALGGARMVQSERTRAGAGDSLTARLSAPRVWGG